MRFRSLGTFLLGRILLFGTLPKICFAGGHDLVFVRAEDRIFDYPKFAEPFRGAEPRRG